MNVSRAEEDKKIEVKPIGVRQGLRYALVKAIMEIEKALFQRRFICSRRMTYDHCSLMGYTHDTGRLAVFDVFHSWKKMSVLMNYSRVPSQYSTSKC